MRDRFAMTDFLAANGKPFCFDADDFYDPAEGLDCDGCPIAYQEQMLRKRRCFPSDPSATPVRHLMDRVPDGTQVRALLAHVRVGFISDKLNATPGYLR
jgi:hypothetical protein